MTPSPNEVERLADAATREIHGDDYRLATRLIIEKALRDALRSEGREDAAPVCPECYGTGRTDNHVTGEVECFHCEGAGTIDTAAPDEAREYVSVPREPTDEMLYLMCRAINSIDEKRDSYRAMLTAAPPAPEREGT